MQNRAGQIEDGAQIGPAGLVGAATDGGEQARLVGQRQPMLEALAGGGQFGGFAR